MPVSEGCSHGHISHLQLFYSSRYRSIVIWRQKYGAQLYQCIHWCVVRPNFLAPSFNRNYFSVSDPSPRMLWTFLKQQATFLPEYPPGGLSAVSCAVSHNYLSPAETREAFWWCCPPVSMKTHTKTLNRNCAVWVTCGAKEQNESSQTGWRNAVLEVAKEKLVLVVFPPDFQGSDSQLKTLAMLSANGDY